MRSTILPAALALVSFLLAARPCLPAEPLPPVPASTERLVDALAPADEAAARSAWRGMNEADQAGVIRAGGRNVLRLPCRFAGTTTERASWDFAHELDMNGCRGLELQFFSRDCSSVGSFSVYFRSGQGWYHGHFFPDRQNAWSTVRIDKQATRTEGTPAGWGKVDLIRVSAWRGRDADAEFCLADLRLVGADAPIAIIRGEALAARDEGEAKTAAHFAEIMDRQVTRLGLDCISLSDIALDAAALANRKLVILPLNGHIPDASATALRTYLAGGGKMLAFYNLSGELARAAGIQGGPHVRQKAPGDFASIRPSDTPLPGLPAQTAQASWNIHAAKPIEGKARVAAYWYDAAGQSTGHAALIASDNCVFMTHVLLEDDAPNKQRMLLAMIASLRADLPAGAIERQIAQAAHVGGAKDWSELERTLGTLGAGEAARTELERGLERTAAARAHLKASHWSEAMDAVASARGHALRAWCMAQRPQAGEHRAFWCHSAFGVKDMTWEQVARKLADNGFTAVIPNMLWGGSADYKSDVLPVRAEVAQRGDQVALAAAACRKAGIACHVWKVNYNCGHKAPPEFLQKLRGEGRLQCDQAGKEIEGPWLCPSDPANQKLEIDSMVELARKYDIDGVHFDYIRYPGRQGCFCEGCRKRFEQSVGRAVANWPADLRRDKELEQKWLQWRRDQITAVVSGTAAILRKEKPKVKISAAVFSNYAVDRDGVGQDWKLWCERGWLDFVCPMDYTESDGHFETLVAQQKQWAGSVPCYPGIGLSCWGDKDVCNVVSKIAVTRRLKTGGFTIFNLSSLEINDILPLLGLGATRP